MLGGEDSRRPGVFPGDMQHDWVGRPLAGAEGEVPVPECGASKARHICRSSASSRRRSPMRVPTFSAWEKHLICQRNCTSAASCRRCRGRALGGQQHPVQRFACLLPFAVAGRRGGFSYRAETAIMRVGGSPARSFRGSKSTGAERSVSFAVRPFCRFGSPQAGTLIVRSPAGSVSKMCTQRFASPPAASATRRVEPRAGAVALPRSSPHEQSAPGPPQSVPSLGEGGGKALQPDAGEQVNLVVAHDLMLVTRASVDQRTSRSRGPS